MQILANLANFAYDPINYEFMRQLAVLDLFLDCVAECSRPRLVEYAVAGLCNSALDRENKEYILRHGGLPLVIACLSSECAETVVSAITTLMFLTSATSTNVQLTSPSVIDAMLRFAESRNPRISNLARIYLDDYCRKVDVDEVRKAQTIMSAVGTTDPS